MPGAEHLDGPAVGALATRVRAGRVLLTHLQMGFDRDATIESVRARFDGPVELVDPGFETTIARLRRTRQNDRGTPPRKVERLDRTPLGVATHEWGMRNEPADRRAPEGSDDRLGEGA